MLKFISPRKVCAMLLLFLCVFLISENVAEAKRKHRNRKRSYPPITHPVVLWAKTISESTDLEQRKVAAFKLSQYSQPIYQENVVNVLVQCMKDPEVTIKVLCAKAMGRAGRQSTADKVRKELISQYKSDPTLRSTIVRAFITRKDNSPLTHDLLLDTLKKSQEPDELTTLLLYFEQFGNGSNSFVEALQNVYKDQSNVKVRTGVVKALADRAQGQDSVVDLLVECSQSKDTPLLLTCLSGLQSQAQKEAKIWPALEKNIESEDPDVLLATLDVLDSLPERPNSKMALRLLEIINDSEDLELKEKAVLGLGICGDQNLKIVETLQSVLEQKENEGIRIAAALVLGKQAASYSEKPKAALAKCHLQEKSVSLRTACQIGLKELGMRKPLNLAVEPITSETSPREPAVKPSTERSDTDP